jgi:hypothetical protein
MRAPTQDVFYRDNMFKANSKSKSVSEIECTKTDFSGCVLL